MENEQKFFKQQWWRRLLLSADNRIHYPEAVGLYHMVMGLGIVSALDFDNRGYSACYPSRMGGKKMIQTIIQLLASNPALFKDCEHRVCDARLAFRRKHGRAKKMRKNELVRLYLEAMNAVNSGNQLDYDGVVCKDCKRRRYGRCFNYRDFHPAVADNWFCADGERKGE